MRQEYGTHFPAMLSIEIYRYKLKSIGHYYIHVAPADRPFSSYSARAAVKISQMWGFVSAESIARVSRSLRLFPIGNFYAIVNELLRIA